MGKIPTKKELKTMIVHCAALSKGVEKTELPDEHKKIIINFLYEVSNDCKNKYNIAR